MTRPSTDFNGVKLLDGSVSPIASGGTGFIIQIGANADPAAPAPAVNSIDIASALGNADPLTGPIGVAPGSLSVVSHANAMIAITAADAYMDWLNQQRGNLGAIVNRLQGTANNLSIGIENLSASESRIRNTDVASESAKLTQAQILQQAASTILAQANQAPNLALQLLRGN